MKSKLLIASLGLVAASAYAQPSMPAGVSPPVNRPEVSPTSMPQPAMQRPAPQPAVGATGGNGGNGGLLGGNSATPLPPTMPRGVGPSPLKNDDVGVQKEYVRYEEYEKGDFDVTKTPYAPGNGNVKAYMK